jgi:XTP/dITP diphosphohydrolase
MIQLLIATGNRGKLDEINLFLRDLPFQLLSLKDVPEILPIAETGETFIANASLKAIGYARHSGILTLADDSGLEVAALGGAPGVLSARYAGDRASDADRTRKLLNALSDSSASARSARFVSAVAISSQSGKILSINEGICEGHISLKPRGTGGFGYDPIFIPTGFNQTFAELQSEVKNQISHRARAVSAARCYLASLTLDCNAR